MEELPPKMTHILQVVDLGVNGPLKASTRRMSIRNLLTYFQDWKIRCPTAAAAHSSLPCFSPPKPNKLADDIHTLLEFLRANGMVTVRTG